MRNCNSSRALAACKVYMRMRLAARGSTQATRRRLGQPGEFAHANNDGPGPGGPRPHPQSDPCAARSLDPECTRPIVPNGNALMMRMRPFWVMVAHL